MAAVGEAVSERGYQATIVLDIVKAAGVSRRTFYDLFAGKEEAFCAAHEEALGMLEEEVRRACGYEPSWPGKVDAALEAALRWAAVEPRRAHLLFAEPLSAGPRPAYCHDRLVKRFAPLLRRGRILCSVDLHPSCEEVLLGGLASVVGTRLDPPRAASLPALAPSLAEFLLAPYLGPGEARGFVRAES